MKIIFYDCLVLKGFVPSTVSSAKDWSLITCNVSAHSATDFYTVLSVYAECPFYTLVCQTCSCSKAQLRADCPTTLPLISKPETTIPPPAASSPPAGASHPSLSTTLFWGYEGAPVLLVWGSHLELPCGLRWSSLNICFAKIFSLLQEWDKQGLSKAVQKKHCT